MPTEHFCLKWNNYQTNIVSALGNLKLDEDFVDVTLSCEGRKIKAHKVILSACSDYFKEVFKDNPCSHPVVILRDASFADVEGLVRYVYRGEVDVQPERLQSFLRTAEVLRIKGLADQNLSSSNEGIKKEESPSQVLSPLALHSLSSGNLAKSIHQQYQQFQLASPPLQQQQQQHHHHQLQHHQQHPHQQQQHHLTQNQQPLQIQSSPHISLSPTVARPLLNPPIKVPVPPTLNRSNTSNNFTSLAQYLSGSPTPVSPISSPLTVSETPAPPKRRKTTPRRHESGNGYLKQPTPPHYSGSTSSLTASPASPPHSNSTEGGDGSLEICEDMDRDNGRRSSESNESPNSSAGHLGGTVTTLSNQTSAFKPHLPRNGLLTPTSSSSSPSGSHGTHLPPSSSPMYKSGSLTNESQDLRMSSGKNQRRPSSPMDFHDAEERPLVIEENQKDEEGGEDEEGNHHESSPLDHAYGETLDLSNKGGSRPNSSHSQRSPLGIGQQTSPLLGLIKSHQASVVTPSFPHNNNNNTNNSGTPLPIMATHINTASVVAPVPVSLTGRVSGGQVLEAALSAAAAHPALGSPVAIAAAAMAVAATTNSSGKAPGQIRRTSTAGSSSSTSSTASSGTSKEQQTSAGLIASQGLLLTPGNNLAKATHGKPTKGQTERKASSASPNNNSSSSPITNINNNNNNSTNNNNNNNNTATGNGTHPRNRWRCMQPRVCPYCWKTFSNSFNLKQHTINVHIQSQGVTCEICEKVVKNKWYLRKHLVTAHGAPLKRSKDGSGAIKQVNSNTGEGGVSQDDDEDHDMTEEEMDDDDDEEIVVDDQPPVSTKDPKKKSSQAKERKVLASTN